MKSNIAKCHSTYYFGNAIVIMKRENNTKYGTPRWEVTIIPNHYKKSQYAVQFLWIGEYHSEQEEASKALMTWEKETLLQ